jgi:hypothetical protein
MDVTQSNDLQNKKRELQEAREQLDEGERQLQVGQQFPIPMSAADPGFVDRVSRSRLMSCVARHPHLVSE